MKKIILAALALTFATSAFAAPPRECRDWRHDRHHHRYCAHWR
jgi:hypothetical protein